MPSNITGSITVLFISFNQHLGQDDDQPSSAHPSAHDQQPPQRASSRNLPPTAAVMTSSADSSEDVPPPVQPPSANRTTPLATYQQLGKRSHAWELDEAERKRRKEAEELVKSMKQSKSFTCGVSYTGDEAEKRYSDDAKESIRSRLPALHTHRHLFRYMVWGYY